MTHPKPMQRREWLGDSCVAASFQVETDPGTGEAHLRMCISDSDGQQIVLDFTTDRQQGKLHSRELGQLMRFVDSAVVQLENQRLMGEHRRILEEQCPDT